MFQIPKKYFLVACLILMISSFIKQINDDLDTEEKFLDIWNNSSTYLLYASELSQIDDKLYLGNWRDASNITLINYHNITQVITLMNFDHNSTVLRGYTRFNIVHKFYSIGDNINEDIRTILDLTYTDITQHAGKTLIHCFAGISRSAICAVHYVYKMYQICIVDAYSFVKNKRNIIHPNKRFMDTLKNVSLNLQ